MIEDRVLAFLELSEDLFFHKIPQEKILYYIDNSLMAGREAARLLENQTIEHLYHQKKIKIQYQETGKSSFGVMLRGQMTMAEDGCMVELYKQSLDSFVQESKEAGGLAMNRKLAEEIHLAHEYFHFIEYSEKKTVAEQLDCVISAKIGKFKRKADIGRCSEIAAHAFAKELLGIPILPNYYDYCYLIGMNVMTEDYFNEMLIQVNRQINELSQME